MTTLPDTIHTDIHQYHKVLSSSDQEICDMLGTIIAKTLPEAQNKIWHRHPVWFIEGNPVVGYDKLKDNVRLLFWSGQSFDEPLLQVTGNFKAAEMRFADISQINEKDIKRWLQKAQDIQWDYKNIVKRKGVLKKLST